MYWEELAEWGVGKLVLRMFEFITQLFKLKMSGCTHKFTRTVLYASH